MPTKTLQNGSIVSTILLESVTQKKERISWDGDKILIVGSIFSNRGDQAMTYTAVDQLSRRFPDKECVVLTIHPHKVSNQSALNFEVISLDASLRAKSLNPLGRVAGIWGSSSFDEFKSVWEDAAFAVDINGYVLSSQMGIDDTLSYILTLMVADEFEVPYYVLPQSIGPFDYNRLEHLLVDRLIKKYIEVPQMIFPREEHGVQALKSYSNRYTEQSPDIVLQHGEYDLKNIFINPPDINVPQFNNKTVGIIPNSRVFNRVSEQKLNETYRLVGKQLDNLGYNVVVMSHCTGDNELCESVHNAIGDGQLLNDSYNAIELEQIINQFEFIIGSRYHSVVHAYKCGVPAIVIGWAVKYMELLQQFDQLSYHFDCRTGINTNKINDAVDKMSSHIETEQQKVIQVRDKIRSNSVLDRVESDVRDHLNT